MATVQELIDSVKEHLGNRAEGTIGARSVNDAVLASVNRGLYKIAKVWSLSALERNLTIDIDDAAYRYALPTTSGSDTIRIKNFITLVILRDGETTGSFLKRLSSQRRDSVFPLTNTSHTGKPAYYSLFAEYIELYPFPDDDFTLYLRVNIWPTAVTSSSASSGIGEEWDSVIEEYATSDCFSKLQQTTDASLWYALYKESLKETIAAFEKRPDWMPSIHFPVEGVPYDSLDPFEKEIQ